MLIEPNKMLKAVSCIGIIPKMPYMQLCCHYRLLVCNAETTNGTQNSLNVQFGPNIHIFSI